MLNSGGSGPDEEMMSGESLAINLTTNQMTRSAASATASENGDSEDSQSSDKNFDAKGSLAEASSPQFAMVPHQAQMQQMLSPMQIQQLLQQQAFYFQRQQQQHEQQLKQLESVIPHLQEQIQINMLQQNQVLQKMANFPMEMNPRKEGRQQLKAQLQQLSLQQHQLIQQLQQSHHQYLLNSHTMQSQYNSNAQGESVDRSWKNAEDFANNPATAAAQSQIGQQTSPPISPETSSNAKEEAQHLLFGHGVCKWPGCEELCEDYHSFVKHLNDDHQLDDRNTAQTRVQMQVVSQLQMQLEKEKSRLQAMMDHLHMKTIARIKLNHGNGNLKKNKLPSSYPLSRYSPPEGFLPTSKQFSMKSSLLGIPSRLSPTSTAIRKRLIENRYHGISGYLETPVRRRAAERVNLDITEEITRNREFYKNADVRPPFTYASLIRQAIIESPERQLTLNEIYTWFQNTFCFFRRNAATWKNAIRTNLSLHKCFVRYEDDFGSFWMVDDCEFVNRRHLSRGRPRKFPETNEHFPASQQPSVGSQQEGQPQSNCSNHYSDSMCAGPQNSIMDNLSSLVSNSPVIDNETNDLTGMSHQLSSVLPTRALGEAETFVHNLVCHGLGLTPNQQEREVFVKQENPSENANGLSEHYVVEEPSGSEEAEDLSQGSPCLAKETANSRTSVTMSTFI